jgi:predicted PurR-regulated permease PerM
MAHMNKEQGFLLVLLSLSGLVSLLLVLPFLQYVIGAVLLAYVLYPVNERLEPVFGPRLAPAVVILAAALVVLVPLAYLTFVVVQDLIALSEGETNIRVDEIETSIRDLTGQDVDLAASLDGLGDVLLEVLFADVSALVSFGLRLSIGLMLVVFLLYYLLRDGDRFVRWLIDVAPMENSVCSRLFTRIDDTAWGVVVGHLLVAVLQGIVGGVGLFIAGVPNAIFWTFAMIVLAVLPIIGAFLVWAPAAAYLFAVGQTQSGLLLFAYGLVVVSLVDNYARPIFIDRRAKLNPAVVLVGVFGGTYAIGATGLFIGPIVLAVFVATVKAFDEEYDALATESTDSDGESGDTPRRAS